MTDPYPTPEPLPYDPDDPETLPYDPEPEPAREHLSAQEAIDRQQEAVVEVMVVDEPPMVTAYKQSLE